MAFLQDLFRPKPSAAVEIKETKETSELEASHAKPETSGTFLVGSASGDPEITGHTLVLQLDDVLSRIPTRALQPGLHDPAQALHFALDELSAGISRGKASISLAQLAARYPHTFRAPERAEDDQPIVLPLQKLIQQIGRASKRAAERDSSSLPLAATTPMMPPPEPEAEKGTLTFAVETTPAEPKLPASEAVPPLHPGLTRFEPFKSDSPSAAEHPALPSPPESKIDAATPIQEHGSKDLPATQPKSLVLEPSPESTDLRKLEVLPRQDPPSLQGVVGSLANAQATLMDPGVIQIEGRPLPPRNIFAAELAAMATGARGKGSANSLVEPKGGSQSGAEPPPSQKNEVPLATVSPLVGSVMTGAVPSRRSSGVGKSRGVEVRPSHLVPVRKEPSAAAISRSEEVPPSAPAPRLPAATVEAEMSSDAISGSSLPHLEEPAAISPDSALASFPAPPAAVPLPSAEVAVPGATPPSSAAAAPPAGEETFRFPVGRPQVRPPSIQGPAGEVPRPEAQPIPTMPGFVFAPRPSGLRMDFPAPPVALAPSMETPEIQMPRLFSQVPISREQDKAASPEISLPTPPTVAPVASPVETSPALNEVLEFELNERAENSTGAASAPAEEGNRQIAPRPHDEEETDLMGAHFALAMMEQQTLQAIFMTEDFLDLPLVSQLSCNFPGVTGCLLVAGDAVAEAGERPTGMEVPALCRLSRQLVATAALLPKQMPPVQTFTLHTGNRALSIFARPHVAVCIVHSHRGFLPGVRERLSAVADTLARGLGDELEEE